LKTCFKARDPFPYSDGLENLIAFGSDQEKAYHQGDLEEYAYTPKSKSKTDFIDGNPNVGHKLHLNVPLEHVKVVSDYLKANDYCHKYLHGGEVEDGKMFTLYIGSHQLAFHLAQIISRDLKGKLARPVE